MYLRFLKISFIAFLAILFIGCGSSDSDSGDDNNDANTEQTVDDTTNDDTANDNNTIVTNQLVDYDCENELSMFGTTMVFKSGSDGSIGYDCQNMEFTMSVNELEIANVHTVSTMNGTVDGATISAIETTDLADGTETIVGTHSAEGSIDCTTTYNFDVPITVYSTDTDNLENLLDGSPFFDSAQISTNCPDDDGGVEEDDVGSMTITREIIITDTSGDVHNISAYTSSER